MGKCIVFFIMFENHEIASMELKDVDVEAILRPFWAHLGVLGRPLGAILGILGHT